MLQHGAFLWILSSGHAVDWTHFDLNYIQRWEYRKYQSLGTPPRLTFQARLLHNQEDVNTDRKTALFGIGTLLVVEQSSLESQSRGCAKTPTLTVCVKWWFVLVMSYTYIYMK